MQDGFYWVTRYHYEQIRRIAPERPEPEVALYWQGRWHFAGDENADDEVWMIHSERLKEPDK